MNTSASGPIATSRYCDQSPAASSASFRRAASGEPGRTALICVPTRCSSASRTLCAAPTSPRARSSITRSTADTAKVTPHAFRHCKSTGDSRVAPSCPSWRSQAGSQPHRFEVAQVLARSGRSRPASARRTPRWCGAKPAMSSTRPRRISTGVGPSRVSRRPRRVAWRQSRGRESSMEAPPGAPVGAAGSVTIAHRPSLSSLFRGLRRRGRLARDERVRNQPVQLLGAAPARCGPRPPTCRWPPPPCGRSAVGWW